MTMNGETDKVMPSGRAGGSSKKQTPTEQSTSKTAKATGNKPSVAPLSSQNGKRKADKAIETDGKGTNTLKKQKVSNSGDTKTSANPEDIVASTSSSRASKPKNPASTHTGKKTATSSSSLKTQKPQNDESVPVARDSKSAAAPTTSVKSVKRKTDASANVIGEDTRVASTTSKKQRTNNGQAKATAESSKRGTKVGALATGENKTTKATSAPSSSKEKTSNSSQKKDSVPKKAAVSASSKTKPNTSSSTKKDAPALSATPSKSKITTSSSKLTTASTPSVARAASSSSKSKPHTTLSGLANELYEAASEHPNVKNNVCYVLTQKDLESLNFEEDAIDNRTEEEKQQQEEENIQPIAIGPHKVRYSLSVNELLPLINELVAFNLFQLVTLDNNATGYRLRSRAVAAKVTTLSNEEKVIYLQVESSGRQGSWPRQLQKKTNLHQTILNRSLKSLEKKGCVKRVTSAKSPSLKLYILTELEPDEEMAGRPWEMEDGETDRGLVDALMTVCEYYIREHSWRKGPPVPEEYRSKKAFKTFPYPAVPGKPETTTQPSKKGKEREGTSATASLSGDEIYKSAYTLVPHLPGYEYYPCASDLLLFLTRERIVHEKILNLKDLGILLDMLVWDGRIERMGNRNVRRPTDMFSTMDGMELLKQLSASDKGEEEEANTDTEQTNNDASEGDYPEVEKEGEEASSLLKGDNQETEHNDDDFAANAASLPQNLPDLVERTESYLPVTEEKQQTFRWRGRPAGQAIEFKNLRKFTSNPLAETPCARCAVFDVCETGGPIDAISCEYLGQWLTM